MKKPSRARHDHDDRIAALIAEWTTGDEVDGLDLVAAAECERLSVAAVWSTLERKGWRVADDGVYRRPCQQTEQGREEVAEA